MTATPFSNTTIADVEAAAALTPRRKRFEFISHWCLGIFLVSLMGALAAIACAMAGVLTDHSVIMILAGLFCACGASLLALWHYATRAAGHGFWRSFLPPFALGLALTLTGAYLFYAHALYGPLGLS